MEESDREIEFDQYGKGFPEDKDEAFAVAVSLIVPSAIWLAKHASAEQVDKLKDIVLGMEDQLGQTESIYLFDVVDSLGDAISTLRDEEEADEEPGQYMAGREIPGVEGEEHKCDNAECSVCGANIPTDTQALEMLKSIIEELNEMVTHSHETFISTICGVILPVSIKWASLELTEEETREGLVSVLNDSMVHRTLDKTGTIHNACEALSASFERIWNELDSKSQE